MFLVSCQQKASVPIQVVSSVDVRKNSPVIEFDTRVHDFGTVDEGMILRHVFKVKNTGTLPLELAGAVASCGCTAAVIKAKNIPPGGSAPLEVTFDTHGFLGTGSKMITVSSNDQRNPESSLEIKYTIERLLGFDHAFVNLQTKRGVDHTEKVWLTGKQLNQAKLQSLKIDGGENLVFVKPIQARIDGNPQKGIEIKLKGKKVFKGYGDITVQTGIADPAELVLRFHAMVI
jgi:hypothetical protein